jgi:hypothetical protein
MICPNLNASSDAGRRLVAERGDAEAVMADFTGRERGIPPGVMLARGVCRAFVQLGHAVLTEVTLINGRRADVMALAPDGMIAIIEVKSSVVDFRADRKWGDYRDFCDALYFAVPNGFPIALIGPECGLIAADAFGAEILRPAPVIRLVPARRKAMTLRFAQLAAQRLHRHLDPGPDL